MVNIPYNLIQESYSKYKNFEKFGRLIAERHLSIRQNRIERAERHCSICNSTDLEDEYHFVIICPVYENIRKELIKPYNIRHPSMYKFIELLKSKNKSITRNQVNL